MVLAAGMGPLISLGTASHREKPRDAAESRILRSERIVNLAIFSGFYRMQNRANVEADQKEIHSGMYWPQKGLTGISNRDIQRVLC